MVGMAYGVVGRPLVQVETGIRNGTSTCSTHKMFGMPCAAQRSKIIAPDPVVHSPYRLVATVTCNFTTSTP